jgi:hypothetical protein
MSGYNWGCIGFFICCILIWAFVAWILITSL